VPSGADQFKRRQETKEQQRVAQGAASIKADYFAIAGGTFAVVRFLEQGPQLTFADVHRIPIEGRQYPSDFICLDNSDDGTHCPGCQSANDKVRRRVTKGFVNLIWRDGPVYERNEYGSPKKVDGKVVITGRADGVFLWKCSSEVFAELVAKDDKYKGLSSRDFEIRRTGSGMQDTKYAIDPADVDGGPQPMSIADMALAETGKLNLVEITTPLSYENFLLAMQGQGQQPNEGPQPTMDRSALTSADTVFQGGEPLRSSAFTRA
jgi:hypothetical protein